MPINQISTSNTFGQWLGATQTLIANYNYFQNDFITVANTANNMINLNAAFTATYSGTFNTALAFSNTANATYNTVNAAFSTANAAYDKANNALLTANSIFYQVFDITTSPNTHYPALFRQTSGNVSNAYVSSSKLYYNITTGELSSVNFNSVSDINRKENIQTIADALVKVLSIRGVSFTWKDNGKKSMGVVAQEIEQILPEVVTTNDDGEKSVSYGSLIGLLIEAIKDQQKQIDTLNSFIVNKD